MSTFIVEFRRIKLEQVNTGAFFPQKLVQNKDIKIGSPNSFASRFVPDNDNLPKKTLYFVIYDLGNYNWPPGQVPGC